ncbi:DUF3278 domain-containing protein [Loigolactobacillus bifermentans]|uniref:DUF3278 domain-containing protein n=1 Tax=Loigolactobacillus bifermentans DSM 20003 TaxID=1423726 RepID=A0A0R1GXN6_9LACO|nr:DUF3278 domain-containing protein [Loigolactobacillus bifermentans]KRK39116.1 hypothetical protein FC07_GL002837 [Loigolactobacillus bifermentans DSM 20003]QGG58999.1 DUF3278 domain-containing protein [Loigolactobacillus bifermentans]
MNRLEKRLLHLMLGVAEPIDERAQQAVGHVGLIAFLMLFSGGWLSWLISLFIPDAAHAYQILSVLLALCLLISAIYSVVALHHLGLTKRDVTRAEYVQLKRRYQRRYGISTGVTFVIVGLLLTLLAAEGPFALLSAWGSAAVFAIGINGFNFVYDLRHLKIVSDQN